ncbi:hypothetical protein SDJN03_25041, partial [Cucurbita argyrosperma subsp. sororia]
MVVFKNLDPVTSNVDSGNEGQPIEETASAEAVQEPVAQSASRDQLTVVITLEALQSLIESRVDQAVQSRVDQAVQATLAGLGSQTAPTALVSGQATLVSEAPGVGVQTAIPPNKVDRATWRYCDELIVDLPHVMGRQFAIKCGLTHVGSCNVANKTYYNYGKTGHLARVCRSAKNPNVIHPE